MHRPDFYYTRKVLSWLFFLAGLVNLICFFVGGAEQIWLLILAFVLFILAYMISPHQKNNAWDTTELLLDEWVIEIVFKVLTWPFRLLKKLFDSADINP